MNLAIYLKRIALSAMPRSYFHRRWRALADRFRDREDYIRERVDYYLKLRAPFSLPPDSPSIKGFKHKRQSLYYADLKEFLHYFPGALRFSYHFGDETLVPPHPTLIKARPIAGPNENSVLFKLEKKRHFQFLHDPANHQDKWDRAVFRGAVYQPHRVQFMEKFWDHPRCDAGQSKGLPGNSRWQKPFMSIRDQLRYKFIVSLEGYDVATNLKWIMSSNSIAVSPRLRREAWFMEGRLEAGKHYIEIKDDYSDFDEKMDHYIAHPAAAENILRNAHDYILPFRNEALEDFICIRVLERYFRLSGQL